MNDDYRITDTPAETHRGVLRPMLWVGLILTIAANVIASSILGNPLAGSAFGAVALACAAALIVNHYRNRGHR